MERYKRFCIGRAKGFLNDCKPERQECFPAASAIGSDGAQLTVCFVASKTPGLHVENPRQTSAFRYPPKYGPQSPSFSRATVHKSVGEQRLFLAGTASVVGHESLHIGDIDKQLSETLRNIESLLSHIVSSGCAGFADASHLSLVKIYLREKRYHDLVRAKLEKFFAPETKSIFLRGDICRSDLLMEIECIGINTNG